MNNKWKNVFIHNIAIGPDHSEISFVNNLGGSNGPYGLNKIYEENDSTHLLITKVQSCGVDELINEKDIGQPDFIKFDLESAEEFALKNGDQLYREKRPFILLELHGEKARESACIFLEQYNYEAILIGGFKTRQTVIRSREDFYKIKDVPHMVFCLPL